MAEYEEVTGSLDVPKNVGIKGFLRAIEGILKLPRVQHVSIDARGKIDYRHFVREGAAHSPLEVSFDSLTPYAVIRNSVVTELVNPADNAAVALGALFNMLAMDQLFPVALAVGANTHLWDWYERSVALAITARETLYGVPVLLDRFIEDDTVVLCGAYARSGALIDTQKSYKLAITQVHT